MSRLTQKSGARGARQARRNAVQGPAVRGPLRVRRKPDADLALAACAAERVRFARTKTGLSQEALAERAGLARPNVTRLEAGRHLPSLSTLRRVAEALGAPLAFFLTLPVADAEDRALAEADLAGWRDELERQDEAR